MVAPTDLVDDITDQSIQSVDAVDDHTLGKDNFEDLANAHSQDFPPLVPPGEVKKKPTAAPADQNKTSSDRFNTGALISGTNINTR